MGEARRGGARLRNSRSTELRNQRLIIKGADAALGRFKYRKLSTERYIEREKGGERLISPATFGQRRRFCLKSNNKKDG
jgi:hypothetical protein